VPQLDPEQIDHFHEQGYVVVPGVLEAAEIERYKTRAREIALGDLPDAAANRLVKDIAYAKGLRELPADPEHALWKIINPDRFDAVMAECLRFPRVLEAVSSLIGEDLLAFLLMFIYKPPGLAQSVHPFHQDAAYFPFGPQEKCLGVWIPLDPVHRANGTLSVVPGSHKLQLRRHEAREGINFGAFAAEGAEEDESFRATAIDMELAPGDCLLFSTRLLHRSGGNETDQHRRVVTLHMASATCRSNGPQLSEYGFTLVRGRTHEGCLRPVSAPSLAFANRAVEN